MAFLIISFVHYPEPERAMNQLPHATTHHDSMLFAAGLAAMATLAIERVGKHSIRRALFFAAIICIGIISNGRRLAWVQVGITFIGLYFITPDNVAKRALRKLLIVGAPLGVLYVAVGWNSGSSIFKPVRSIRTAMDPSTDASTMWRELENYNIVMTLRKSPIFGVGFGNGYDEIVPMPVVPYALERYVPHNTILGFWTYAGPLGWTALSLLWACGVFFAMRGYHAAQDPSWRAAALVTASAVLIYLIQCWGDMGLGTWTGVYIVAPALAIGGKLAVATRAWPVKT